MSCFGDILSTATPTLTTAQLLTAEEEEEEEEEKVVVVVRRRRTRRRKIQTDIVLVVLAIFCPLRWRRIVL